MDLYREEFKVWKECASLREAEESEESEVEAEGEVREGKAHAEGLGREGENGGKERAEKLKVPGAYEW